MVFLLGSLLSEDTGENHFCRAMLRRVRLCHSISSVRLSVRLTVTFRYSDHIGWNTSKIISRPNSLRFLLALTPTWAIWWNGNTPKIRVDKGGVMSTKTCNISVTVQNRPKTTIWNRITRFRLIPKSMTDLGWPWTAETNSGGKNIVLRSQQEKFE